MLPRRPATTGLSRTLKSDRRENCGAMVAIETYGVPSRGRLLPPIPQHSSPDIGGGGRRRSEILNGMEAIVVALATSTNGGTHADDLRVNPRKFDAAVP